MSSGEDTVLQTIAAMEQERRDAHRFPCSVLFRDLRARLGIGNNDGELRRTLNGLVRRGMIITGRTINDRWISTSDRSGTT